MRANRIVTTMAALITGIAALALPAAAGSGATPAPDFTLPMRDGGSVNLASLKGQVVMINFWAS